MATDVPLPLMLLMALRPPSVLVLVIIPCEIALASCAPRAAISKIKGIEILGDIAILPIKVVRALLQLAIVIDFMILTRHSSTGWL